MIVTDDYRNAPSGIGPLAAQWEDKPHRLVYDLCAEVERLRKQMERLQKVEVAAHTEVFETGRREVNEKRSAFNRGVVIACCNLTNLHNAPELASDVLIQAGISVAEMDAMDLTEYDAKALAKIRAARRLDPLFRKTPESEGESLVEAVKKVRKRPVREAP